MTVSIIMPVYNNEKYVTESIESVKKQTYQDWELLIINDKSTDNSLSIVKEAAKKDSRIRIIDLKENKGVANARNVGMSEATGKYIAFLDGDDLWAPEKLEKQIKFMKENNATFTNTFYGKINQNSEDLNITITSKLLSNYDDILKHSMGNSTVVFDRDRLGNFKVPNIRKRNDYALWLKVIKKAKVVHTIDEVLAYHRIGDETLSSNKSSLVKYHIEVYRELEGLSLFKSYYLVLFWISKILLRKLNNRKG
ncbi:glycosyltransferase family 2 protein [Macrococcoides bohemicum]|uniref:glycosyltransferase family 2 protein n=1 Tax=Macrococcoides bohemicum TaxID=1903056 RepID=UPI00165D5D37|nr:glycosyltransferase family 2 protein [Macrococcus bohemicus]MBC9875433.1 glycosyltransferase family 2 protein [Macrococcus bohemicus]